MNEVRVIALAGVFQGIALTRQLATEGKADEVALNASMGSVLKVDAESSIAVFGGLMGVRLGLQALITQLDSPERDLVLTHMAISVLRLQRQLERRSDMLGKIRDGIVAATRQATHFNVTHPSVLARLAEVYSATLSQLRPRIVLQGNPLYLTHAATVDQIRASLLAAVRAAVLWRQVGGRQWRLILKRREYAMIARGLLARCTLDAG